MTLPFFFTSSVTTAIMTIDKKKKKEKLCMGFRLKKGLSKKTHNWTFFLMWNLHFEDNFLQIFLWLTELLFFNIWILLFVIMITAEHVGRFRSTETVSKTWTLNFSSSLFQDVLPSSFYKTAHFKIILVLLSPFKNN